MKTSITLVCLFALMLTVAPGNAQESAESTYGSVKHLDRVTLTDVKGVKTTAYEFSKLFADPQLTAFRGASQVVIPFDRIASFQTSKIVDDRMPMLLFLRSGREMDVLLDRTEYSAMFGGSADFGYFRIRLQDIKTLVFHREKPNGKGEGQECPNGHIFYNNTWKYCPYDGKKLHPIQSGQ